MDKITNMFSDEGTRLTIHLTSGVVDVFRSEELLTSALIEFQRLQTALKDGDFCYLLSTVDSFKVYVLINITHFDFSGEVS